MNQEAKKVTIFVGSAHKGGATCRAACRLREELESYGDVQGWFQSGYFYPTRLGPFKKAAGAFFDWVAARVYPQRESEGAIS